MRPIRGVYSGGPGINGTLQTGAVPNQRKRGKPENQKTRHVW